MSLGGRLCSVCGHPVSAHLCLMGEAVMVEMDLTYVKCWMWPYVWHVASELRVDIEVKISMVFQNSLEMSGLHFPPT